jgi:hypothetical protein
VFCRKCGAQNDDNNYRCGACGEVLQGAAAATSTAVPGKKIDNNLVLAIVVTVLCCLPFGIVGIVYAAQVNGKVQAGDIAGAEDAARKAKLWSLWGLGIGLALAALYGIAIFGGLMANLSRQ